MKKWKKPELIILYKAQPEESILASCKSVWSPRGPERVYNKCDRQAGGSRCRGACHPQSGGLS